MRELLERHYGYLFEEALLDEIEAAGQCKKVKQGEILMDIGQNITAMPLLFSGAIKIMREDHDGDELILYFIEKGDTCAMTFSCCMGTGKSEIRAVAEVETDLLMIPIEKMEEWLSKYSSWRKFILDSYHTRLSELMETVDTLAFMKMDERLLKYLRDKAMVTQNEVIHATHQEVAHDLHTSRVVVSRLLKSLENEGIIKLHRNQIEILHL
ncbi:MAG: Crp/Fnr family transcriptional regulator [Flavobacteriaceae bacterium]|nr:Crp/Fnr family transcriptional regulator [Eudoraea sp.]NNJ38800.1 Crp/Fnr family transcriptional regulator [Flavobacteriaceae bacterium]